MTDDEVLRFFSHVEGGLAILLDIPNGIDREQCWMWKAGLVKDGYGCFSVAVYGGQMAPPRQGRRGNPTRPAHRVSYEHFRGPIPAHLPYLDHIVCDRRSCVNPWHTEPSTPAQNTLRIGPHGGSAGATNALKTHCPEGHPYDEANTFYDHGARKCRTCVNGRNRQVQLASPPRGPRPGGFYVATHCRRGHAYTEENTYWYRGGRTCRTCRRERYEDRRRIGSEPGRGSTAALNAIKVECPKGHPYVDANTYVDKTGRRQCRTCKDQKVRVRQAALTDRSEATPLMLARYPTCKQGHDYTEANTAWYRGQRVCRACARAKTARLRAAKKS